MVAGHGSAASSLASKLRRVETLPRRCSVKRQSIGRPASAQQETRRTDGIASRRPDRCPCLSTELARCGPARHRRGRLFLRWNSNRADGRKRPRSARRRRFCRRRTKLAAFLRFAGSHDRKPSNARKCPSSSSRPKMTTMFRPAATSPPLWKNPPSLTPSKSFRRSANPTRALTNSRSTAAISGRPRYFPSSPSRCHDADAALRPAWTS
jgi:hypothetical protein